MQTRTYSIFLIYVISTYVFSFKDKYNTVSNGIFILFLIHVLMILFKQRERLKFHKNHILLGIFIIYSFSSAFWAIDLNTAVIKSTTLLVLFILSFAIYHTFDKENGVEFILRSLLFAGLVMSLYTVFYYGLSDFVMALINGTRLGTEINQANILGMYAANTVILCLYYAMLKNKKYMYIVAILPFLVSLSSGSRTGLAMAILGAILLILLHNGTKSIFKGIILAIIAGVVVYYLFQLPVFHAVTARFDKLMNVFNHPSEVDSSATKRFFMITFGIEQFKHQPIWGYGANCARYLLSTVMWSTYLHNNYVELLVDYGLIGFVLYYSIYVSIFIKTIPMLKYKNPEVIVTIVLLILQLLSDYGTVSYYQKSTYIILTVGLLITNYKNNTEFQIETKQENDPR